jgi:hypothetical protein
MKATRFSLLVVFLTALAVPSSAQPTDDDPKTVEARNLADEGFSLFEGGDYAGALGKFDAALALVRAPKIGLYAARSAERLGRLMEASKRYLAVATMPIPKTNVEIHREAQSQADAERADLLLRIPRLAVAVKGAKGNVVVKIDDVDVSLSALERGYLLEPGDHRVVAESGGQVKRVDVRVAEREIRNVEIHFEPRTATIGPAPSTGPRPPRKGADGGGGLAIAGWTGVGLGGAALVAGAVMGGVLLTKQSDLETQCGEDLDCSEEPSVPQQDLDSYNALRTPTTVLLIAGGVLAAAGVTLVAVDAAGSEGETALWISPGGLGVRGRF